MAVPSHIQKRLTLAADRRGDELALLRELLGRDDPPLSPWAAWALCVLVRHHERQEWVAAVVRGRLGGDPNALAECGAFGHPVCPQAGLVPGLTEWEYDFHGRGCCLTHRGTGESIDVNFYGDSGEWFDDYFVVNYLNSLKAPPPAEGRLKQLHPSGDTLLLAFDELLEAGLVEKHPESKVFRLAFDGEWVLEQLGRAEAEWADEARRCVYAAALGDWMLAADNVDAVDSAMRADVENRAERCRRRREGSLTGLYEQEPWRRFALAALDEIGSPLLPEYLRRALAGEFSGTTSAALKVIGRLDDPTWCGPLAELLQRVDPNGPIPQPHIWQRCLEFLLRHGHSAKEVRRRLEGVESHSLGEAAVLALEHAPDLALDLFRRALQSPIPHNRITAAAVFGVLDQEWCRRELLAVLAESDDQLATCECRAALMESRSPAMHEEVRRWEERNPHEPECGPYITFDEMSLRDRGETIRWEMHKWHDRVLPLRHVVPPEPATAKQKPKRRWWPWT